MAFTIEFNKFWWNSHNIFLPSFYFLIIIYIFFCHYVIKLTSPFFLVDYIYIYKVISSGSGIDILLCFQVDHFKMSIYIIFILSWHILCFDIKHIIILMFMYIIIFYLVINRDISIYIFIGVYFIFMNNIFLLFLVFKIYTFSFFSLFVSFSLL